MYHMVGMHDGKQNNNNYPSNIFPLDGTLVSLNKPQYTEYLGYTLAGEFSYS